MRCSTVVCMASLIVIAAIGVPVTAQPCELPDNGGTVFLPPEGCPYLSPQDVHLLIDGLPPDTEIIIDASHERFFQIEREDDGEGGENEQFMSSLFLSMRGTGELEGFKRNLLIPNVQCRVNTGPRGGGDVQTFPTEFLMLQGGIAGDADFLSLQIIAGSDFGLPSPGETTLTRLDSETFNVDSFFDMTYQIEFVGAPGGALEGLSGTTERGVLMQTGEPAGGDRGACCRGTVCTIETREECAGGCIRNPPWQCDGDTDGDGQVNPVDSGLVQAAFGSQDETDLCQYDIDCDGQINPVDSGIVQSLFGTCNEPRTSCGTPGVWQGPGTDCDPNPCLPRGACCLPDGTCIEVTEEQCAADGGAYQGDDTNCDEQQCPQPTGACCLPDGNCIDGGTREECAANGGNYQGDGTTCDGVECPQPVGACCLPDGNCVQATSKECAQRQGEYQGDNTDCADVECPQPVGACCLPDGNCIQATQEECSNRQGQYQGDGIGCAGIECPQPLGACCLADGTCIEVTEEQCNADGGVYQGDFVACDQVECPQPVGACCLPDGNCVQATSEECANRQGEFQGDDTDCANVECPQPVGACCLPDGNCVQATSDECAQRQGEYQGDNTDCANVECPQPIGACCLPDGNCVQATSDECAQRQGEYQGDDTDCANVECPQPVGACCLPDGNCVQATSEECAQRQGEYQGDDTDCANVECPQPVGACCLPDGNCVQATQEECANRQGQYQGDGIGCAGIECPQPRGACCLADGTCIEVTEEQCDADGGVYQGDFVTCDQVECPQPVGACCLPDGNCVQATSEECANRQGNYQGDNTDCANVECPQPRGACCLADGTCIEVTEEQCNADRGVYQGDDVSCDEIECPQPEGACCLRDGTCVQATRDECGQLQGDYQGDNTDCRNADCPQPRGACCLDDGTCVEITREQCAADGGTYQGDFVACAGVECPQPEGACCLPDGNCVQATREECANRQGAYQGDNTECRSVECPQPAGACCLPEGGCEQLSQEECRVRRGIYRGDGSDCPADCSDAPGACCLDDGGGGGDPCERLDNGNGTVNLPPEGCGYISPQRLHRIIEGLPPGTEIIIAPIHMGFINIQRGPDGEGGEIEQFDSTLIFDMTGTGELEGFHRVIEVEARCLARTGPRNLGENVQTFPTEMVQLQGQLFGDPDFEVLQVIAGRAFGLPSPGETTLTRLGRDTWNVDSFFDMEYQIEFVGAPGSILEGLSGSTQGNADMRAGRSLGGRLCVETVRADCEQRGGDFYMGRTCDEIDCNDLVPAGPDCWLTTCGDTEYNFCEVPIPADFFDPGSEPFDGSVLLRGAVPGEADTQVNRLSGMDLSGAPPVIRTIDIEIVALDLVSCEPITVDIAGEDVLWDVEVHLSDVVPPPGQMEVTKEHANGGTFVSEFSVQPVLTFIRVDDPAIIRVLDTGAEGLEPDQLTHPGGAPWVFRLRGPGTDGCGRNFNPGAEEDPGTGKQCCRKICHPGGTATHCNVVGYDCSSCPDGACCLQSGQCVIVSPSGDQTAEEVCEQVRGGDYQGDTTTCDDGDGDGIPDVYENNECGLCADWDRCNVPTDPSNPDTDGDGCMDGEELAAGTDPCDECSYSAGCVTNPCGACCEKDGTCTDGVPASECAGRHFPETRCSDDLCAACTWDNNIVPDGFNARSISPPVFPDIRVADDFTFKTACVFDDLHTNIIEDAGWTDGGDAEVCIYADTGGAGPGAALTCVTVVHTKMDTGEVYFGRRDYDYWYEGLGINLAAGTYWVGVRNANGGGAGTNYWMTSDGGPDGPGSDTGWFSLDAGATWAPEGAGWHHAFEIYP